jgi:hypothetical protein
MRFITRTPFHLVQLPSVVLNWKGQGGIFFGPSAEAAIELLFGWRGGLPAEHALFH